MQRAFLSTVLCLSVSACIGDSRAAQPMLPAQSVVLQPVAESTPSARGAVVLADGQYDLVASKVYIGAGGDARSVPRLSVAERLSVQGGKIQFFTKQDGAITNTLASLTFCGAELSMTFTSGPSVGITRVVGFSGEGDAIEIVDQNQVRTYVLRTGTESGVERPVFGVACKSMPGAREGLASAGR